VTCHNCRITCNRFGKHRNGLQRFRCSQCRKTFTEAHDSPLAEMRLPIEKAITILQLLVEGMSIRSIERVTQVHRDTIMRLLILAGERCDRLMREKMRNLTCQHIQADEIWTFVQKKNRRVYKGTVPDEFGDQWIFVAMDADTKLVPAFTVGKRTMYTTQMFCWELAKRLANRIQLTTDGFHFYKEAVLENFGVDIDFAQLVKLFGDYGQRDAATRYSPSPIKEVISKVRIGNPDHDHISTSFVERQNLTMRMQLRRLTRLTNAFSKKLSHLKAAVALHFAWYNFCRVHSSLGATPVMKSGLSDHAWTLNELIGVHAV
jgi:transposase-like protein/IS1 family transposase